jgi:Flp pilus assembly protein TadG
MRRLVRLRVFACDRSGATAIEYALVMPLLAMMILGGIWAGLLTFSVSSLQMATQSAARCFAVNTSQCGTPSSAQTFAQTRYAGPNISPVFTASYGGCGHTVAAQANFDLNIVPGISTIPLTATACYP